MKRRIEFPLEDGTGELVVVEVEQPLERGLDSASRGRVVERAEETFDAALARIKPAMTRVVASIREAAQAPDEITLEFGFKFDAKSGVVISSIGVEANLGVTLKWRRDSASPSTLDVG